MASGAPGRCGAAPGAGKKRSRIPVRVCPRPHDVNSPICKIQRTLEAMNIDCGKGVAGTGRAAGRHPNVSSAAGPNVWWNTAATISWASGVDTSTPQTFSTFSTDHPDTSVFTPVSTPNFTPFHRGNKAQPPVMETPDCTPVTGGLLRRAATQHPIHQHSHMNMVTPGSTPVVSSGAAGQCWSTSGKQVKTSTPCWMSMSSVSSSDLVLPTPPSSIKRPFPYPVPSQDSMEYIQVDSCPQKQKKLPRRRLPVVGEEPHPPPESVQTLCVESSAVLDHDLGVSTLDSSTQHSHTCYTTPGLEKDKETLQRQNALVCATPTPEPAPTLHPTDDSVLSDISKVITAISHLPLSMPTDSIEEGDCLVPQSPYTNKHIPNHFQLKEGLIEIEDQLLGKEHSESCLHDVGVSSENRKEPSLKENTQDRAKEESVSRQGDNCMCHVGSQKAVNVAGMPKSANGPQNSNITSSNGQGHTGSLVSPQGKTASIKGSHQQSIGMLPGQVTHCERYMYPGGQDNKTRVHVAVPDNVEGVKVAESVNIPPVEWEEGCESGSDSPPPVKVCRLSQPTDVRNNNHRNPPLACVRNSEAFNVLQNRCMESSSDNSTLSSSTVHNPFADSSSLHDKGQVSCSDFKQVADSGPNLAATFADSALGLSVSSFDTDSYMEGSHGLSCVCDTMMTEETDIIVREASSNTSISGGKDGDVQEEQLLTDFKENTKLSGRHVHFKLSPEKHPAPPPSPSDTVPCKTRKQQSPRKIRASPSKLRKSPKKNSPHKCSSPPKLRFSPVKLRSSPGKRCSPSKLQTSTGRSKVSPGKRRHPAEVNKVRKSLLGDFGSVKTPGTIKRKLFSRDLPRRPAQSRCDVAEPAVMETGGMDDSGLALSLSQFVLHERQPGSKVGCDYVDFIGELTHVYNMPMIVESILAYLDPPDLSSMCCVSRQWYLVCVSDREAEPCRQTYLRERRRLARLAPRVGMENIMKWRCRDVGSLPDSVPAALATLQLQQVVTPTQPAPAMSRHEQFSKLARLLPYGHYLTPCIRCRCPAHVFPKNHRATCQQDRCKFDYCLHCNCEFHGDIPCPALTPIISPTLVRGKKVRTSPVAGSKGSKRRLRRL
ncbi:PREDICTED: uncharacterized protein LOC109467629 isoform X1 [Branchiostoma belcheri]|uniref:Uncharacterized protein LOC109467629 isoform X1 n=1 Tax=Branchiostoma belcheri TaxID=7741 RepID=A0A6P4Y9S6_BRABE|nr:PREDICTED: uncharacterized protein LOC109467629 isoform X1 [Branchiostoma belcheri]